jgi:agmatine deiminase
MSSYQMPAEWEPHEGTWLAWPHEKTDWPGKFATIPWVYCEIVKRLAQREQVHILVNDEAAQKNARKLLKSAHADGPSIDFVQQRTDRSWTRDFCPLFVRDERNRAIITDWQFNGWAKYDNWETDDAVPSAIASKLGMKSIQPKLGRRRVVLEGGSIDVNGAGSLLTTEECLLSDVQQRNFGFTREDYESVFAHYLGIRRVLWLHRGIAGDDTHGHVDDLARFVDESTVVIAAEQDKSDENYEPLRENFKLLKTMTDQDGRKLRVVPLPMPAPVYFAGQRLPASYANFYIANGLVLVPTFNDPNDRIALNILAKLFSDREVVGIHAVDLVLGLGTLHCMTQQQIQ